MSTPTTKQQDRSALARLVALWPSEIADLSLEGRLRLLAKLKSALRRERQRGVAGHWGYDLARHSQLVAAYREELRALRALGVDIESARGGHAKNHD